MKKTDVFDYLQWRGDLTFAQSAFNEVDALILSVFAYLDFSAARDGKTLSFQAAVDSINEMSDEMKFDGPFAMMRSVVELAADAALSPRFKEMGVSRFSSITEEEREIQFGAVTFLLPDGTAFLSFRGTDNTLVGWKEDLNMCFTEEIPSQVEAAKYAAEVAEDIGMPMRLGGHSKGGNLAIWAGTHLAPEYQKDILCIYNNDGPGFSKKFLESSTYLGVRERIFSFVPEASIVGVLMEHDEYQTICSFNASVLQHNPFSWVVKRTHFVYVDDRSVSARKFEKSVNSWIRSMTAEEREELVETIYDILVSSNAKTIDDLDKAKVKSFLSMHRTFREMGIKKQAQLMMSLSKLFFNSDVLIGSGDDSHGN